VNQSLQIEGMRQRNPGALGLIEGPRVEREKELAKEAEPAEQEAEQAEQEAEQARQRAQQALQEQQAEQRAEQAWDKTPLDKDGLMQAIVKAINSLEENGYVAPYVCVFGRNPFEAAFIAINNSTVLPRDRIEPLIGRELLHASGIDVLPHRFDLYDARLDKEEWRSRGVLLSMADEPIDLALAAEATPEFRQVDLEGRYVFSVFERFALRIKDAKAVVPLRFEKPKKP
jgi:Encapsulating protein for peroxidase